MNFFSVMGTLLKESGFAAFTWQSGVMILISFVLMYLAIAKKFEPLLLLPIAFGMFLANLPLSGIMTEATPWYRSGLISIIYYGIKSDLFPCLIFMGVGAMTDFGPLIAYPVSLLLGAAAQFGVYVAFILANATGLFTPAQAAAIGIIGGADGPTSIFLANNLAPTLVAPIAVAAYSYMALIPLIQPPIMRLLTTKKERAVKMGQLRKVGKTEKIVFPVFVVLLCVLLLPSVAPLIGMLMLGNLFRESGVVERLSQTAQNELCNIVTIMLGLSVGATANGELFLRAQTLAIIAMGLIAFSFSTAGGLLLGKLLYLITHGKVNPLIGSAGVSAVPMAARVSQVEGRKANPANFLLMHAMGPNVAGVIGTAVAAGFFMMVFGK
ncbi:sodium ion-translocating decarboxylase subunit beta [Caproiciproducens sp. NJN-50]|uniref:sodium ion-translocating decarboxylase subunit beta n=1 Tax=Acutalibacteraceae TaxID=3082771 RepID=UPI000FFE14CA|nr:MULTISPECIES: sodium ion-translocating decarboxylase subunit beta [Acutalibacteraceae]QAT50474.1 sodium ion-translocating decarboxylase subunit beta [Caproiciproducens sp. NJN-50]